MKNPMVEIGSAKIAAYSRQISNRPVRHTYDSIYSSYSPTECTTA